jgi:hypothetical protein
VAFCATIKRKEQAMTNLKVFGAVVIAASALSSSAALAQAALSHPGACEDEFSNCSIFAPERPYAGGYRYRETVNRQPAYGTYDNELAWHGMYGDEYGCRRGTYFRGPDGLRHRCR